MSLHPRQFLKNSSWTILELALYPALMIIATPLFISHLGLEEYGLWMLVSTIGLGMNIFNLGMGDTNIRMIAAYRARNSTGAMQHVFNHNLTLSILLFGVAVLAGYILSATSFITYFYNGQRTGHASMVLWLAAISAGSKFVELNNLSVFKAFERFDLSAKLLLISRNTVVLANILVVMGGGDLADMLLATVCLNLLNIMLQLGVVHLRFGLLRFPGLQHLSFAPLYRNYNAWYWLQSLIGLFGFLADKLLVAWFTDVKTLGLYSIAALIGTQINNCFVAFGSFIFPRVAYKLETDSTINPLYYVSRSLIILPGWALIAWLLLFGGPVFNLWLGPDLYAQSALFIRLYLVFQAGMLLLIVPHQFINGSRDIRLNSLFEVTIRTTHVGCMIAGYYLGGLTGLLYGLIISTFLNVPFQYFFFHRHIKTEQDNMGFLHPLVPAACLAGLLFSPGILTTLGLMACFLLSCKLIYFDSARAYSGNFVAFRKLFAGLESK